MLMQYGRLRMKEAIELFTNWRKFRVKENTVALYHRELRFFCLYLHDPEIESITLDQIMQYFNGMSDLGWEMNSLMPKAIALRKFFEFFRLQGCRVINEDLIPIPAKQYSLPRVANEESYQQLLSSMPTDSKDPRYVRNSAIIRLLWDTGARNGEVLSLDVPDLNFEGRRAIIRTEKSKGRRPFREIFWTGETNDHLIRWRERRDHLQRHVPFPDQDAFFVCINNWNIGYRMTVKAVGEVLRRQCNRAKIPYMNAHSFRHHKGHQIIKSGGSSADAMNVLGHASIQSTTIYTMMTGTELEERARKFLVE